MSKRSLTVSTTLSRSSSMRRRTPTSRWSYSHWSAPRPRERTSSIAPGPRSSDLAADRRQLRPSTPADWLGSWLSQIPDSNDAGRPAVQHGLIAVGSHVGLTTRQLDQLRAAGHILELELNVPTLLEPSTHDRHVTEIATEAARLLQDNPSDSDVVIRTSRTLITGADATDSLVIARTVSAALVGTVREVVKLVRPAFVLAKGGITSSDTATEGLGIRRAWTRGTMLPGIVSLWEPVDGLAQGIPYVVFAGNVGDDHALAAVVATLRSV